MLNYNRFLTQSDLVDFLEEIHENEYEENFPHRDLWAKPDAMLKWISILRVVRSLEGKNLKVIDLSADFRLRNAKDYEKWYKTKHKAFNQIKKSIYSIPEISGKLIKKFPIISCPGCYPTSILLPLIPLLREELIDPSSIIANSLSGVSGAGPARVYSIELKEARDLTVSLTSDFDGSLRLLTDPCDTTKEVDSISAGCANKAGTMGTETLSLPNVAAGTYYIAVEGVGTSDTGNFTLDVGADCPRHLVRFSGVAAVSGGWVDL